jgi:hypothetical protein
VRPTGHPFDRRTLLSPAERRHVEARAAAGATFVVVDEGPGMSGSSFLSVGEALVSAGVPAARVIFLGSRAVDPAALVAPDGAARWRRFRNAAPQPPSPTPPDAEIDLSGGRWRARFWSDPRQWPAASFPTEREKRLSRDGARLFKFEGLGPFGAACAARAEALAAEGFTAAPLAPPDGLGYVAYPWLAGRPLARPDLDGALLQAMGRYCARRAALFEVAPPGDAEVRLLEMARYDVEVTVGASLPAGFRLPCVRPTITDGRMLPHEWFRTSSGVVHKLDATSHGDDHFYPGPTDVAWDVAGAIVEWGLDGGGRAALVASYEAASGDAVEARLTAYEIAYAAFRACFVRMAAHGSDEQERARLERQHAVYRAALERRLAGLAGATA